MIADTEVSANVGAAKNGPDVAKTSGNGKSDKKSIAKALVPLELVKVVTEVVGGKVEATQAPKITKNVRLSFDPRKKTPPISPTTAAPRTGLAT